MSRTVGIDLGTTNSLVAVVENGLPRILARGEERLVPSVVGLSDEGQMLVGRPALNQYVLAPERTVRSVKRKMGTAERIPMGDRSYLPEEISAFILRYLKQVAEESLGENADRAVITVPAYFNDFQRQATRRAGELAGFEVLRIINEPTAAALAYGIDKLLDQYLLVYDLGGGTFDVSLIEQQGEVLEVRASHGNVRLGGDDFDERILHRLLDHLSHDHRYDFAEDRRAKARLIRAAERAKIALSDAPFTRVREEFLAQYDGQIAHLDVELARDELHLMIDDLLLSTLESIDLALKDGDLRPEQLQRVLLVGGSTRIPRVAELIRDRLGLEPSAEINPDEAVALGAAIQAAMISGEEVRTMLIDVAPHTLGIEVASFVYDTLLPGQFSPIIRRNTAVPATKSEVFQTITPDQDTVEIKVFQGESPLCTENSALGEFKLAGIPPGPDPSKQREIIVEFSYNLDGIVEITASDRSGERAERLAVNTTSVGRAASDPERKKHFDPELEREVQRASAEAARLELRLDADGKTKDAERMRKARHAVERAYEQGAEEKLRKAIESLDGLIYDLE